jgi:hypothetical protein
MLIFLSTEKLGESARSTRQVPAHAQNFWPAIPVGNSCRLRIHWTIEAAGIKLVNNASGGWSHAMSEFARKPAESSHALHTVSGPSAGPALELAREKHYSIIEIAELWALSEKTVRKIFEREPGVIHWSTEEKLHKRGYRTLRVPETVLHRVHRKLRIAS